MSTTKAWAVISPDGSLLVETAAESAEIAKLRAVYMISRVDVIESPTVKKFIEVGDLSWETLAEAGFQLKRVDITVSDE